MDNNGLSEDEKTFAERLSRVIQKGNCLLWIGEGLSRCSGLDSWQWKDVVKNLCDFCGVKWPLETDKSGEPNFLKELSEKCRNKNPKRYCDFLNEKFGKKNGLVSEAKSIIKDLDFSGLLTTNFDVIYDYPESIIYSYPDLPIHKMESFKNKKQHPTPGSSPSSTFPVFHIHGRICEDDPLTQKKINIVFAKSDYDTAYGGFGICRAFLFVIFLYYDIIFLGTSFRETEILEIYENAAIHRKRLKSHEGKQMNVSHSIVRPESTSEKFPQEETKKRYEDMGMGTLIYRKPDNTSDEVFFSKFLGKIFETIKGKSHIPKVVPSWEEDKNV